MIRITGNATEDRYIFEELAGKLEYVEGMERDIAEKEALKILEARATQ